MTIAHQFGSTAYGRKHRTILVAGRGEAAVAVVHAIAKLPMVGSVRQIAQLDMKTAGAQLAGGDLLVDMTGGVANAFQTVMAALEQGMACVTANPMLVAAHGRVLRNAARGQHAFFGFQGAGFGMPVAEMMAATTPHKVTVSFVTAASMALARMAFRNESLAHVSAHLKMQNIDLSDWGGKVTQARALALRSQWFNEELRGQNLLRVSVEQVEPADVRRLREFGLQPVFGADIRKDEVYTGPMAVAVGSPLVHANVQDVMVAETEHGDILLTHTADETQRMVAGVIADIRQFLRSAKPVEVMELRESGFKQVEVPERAYVRVPYAMRERVLGFKPEILTERVDGDGLWHAVIAVERVSELQLSAAGGMVYPLSGAWEPPAASSGGLRLVG